MIISHSIQDLSDFFLAHRMGREFFAAEGTFAVPFTQDLDRPFLFFDFSLDTKG
jgi:hypothetical protein